MRRRRRRCLQFLPINRRNRRNRTGRRRCRVPELGPTTEFTERTEPGSEGSPPVGQRPRPAVLVGVIWVGATAALNVVMAISALPSLFTCPVSDGCQGWHPFYVSIPAVALLVGG